MQIIRYSYLYRLMKRNRFGKQLGTYIIYPCKNPYNRKCSALLSKADLIKHNLLKGSKTAFNAICRSLCTERL
jgi:hypothetical protein